MELLDRLVEQILALPTWAQGLALALATLGSEDLACIAAGLIAASGHMHAGVAIAATAAGIWIGDLLLYLVGKRWGRRVVRIAPFSWLLQAEDLHIASEWFARKGSTVIWATRFLPGTRLATYVAAGTLGMRARTFAAATFVAVLVWTPIVAGGAMLLGRGVQRWIEAWRIWAWPAFLLGALLVFVLVKFAIPCVTWRGRRLVVSRWRRLTRWEFWPMWCFYPPVVAYIVWLAVKHRSLSVLTAVNPGLPAGGVVGESKAEILEALARAKEHVARAAKLDASQDADSRVARALQFLQETGCDYPVVLKPDAGQRGSGVLIARSEDQMRRYLEQIRVDCLVQEYVGGEEFGIFYYRFPRESKGHIFSITRKVFPRVVGDGTKNLERLILEDPRAVCMARFYLEKNSRRLFDVPAAGESVQLVEIGSHCRGTVFFDGSELATPPLCDLIDRISQCFEGFYFGRYDVRVPSEADLRAGKNLKVIELNGATSEATSIYDPAHGVWTAYRTLFRQWRILFEIAAENRRLGAEEVHWTRWPGLLARYRAGARSHP